MVRTQAGRRGGRGNACVDEHSEWPGFLVGRRSGSAQAAAGGRLWRRTHGHAPRFVRAITRCLHLQGHGQPSEGFRLGNPRLHLHLKVGSLAAVWPMGRQDWTCRPLWTERLRVSMRRRHTDDFRCYSGGRINGIFFDWSPSF